MESPIPTQVVSNEEILPRPQSEKQKQVERLINEMGEANAKKLGLKRRDFMRTTMGFATALLAMNKVFGNHWRSILSRPSSLPRRRKSFRRGNTSSLTCRRTSPTPTTWGTSGAVAEEVSSVQFLKNMGFNLKADAEAYSFHNFIKEIFFDSETSVAVISGVPSREKQRDDQGKVLEGPARSRSGLPSWLMTKRKQDINHGRRIARAVSGQCRPESLLG